MNSSEELEITSIWHSMLLRLTLGALLLTFGIYSTAQESTAPYHFLNKYTFGAVQGSTREYFDYIVVDGSSRRVYLSHGTEIKVIDADNGSVVGSVGGLKQAHGVALVKDLNRGFITDGAQGKVISFDLKTFKVTGETKAAEDVDAIIYDPAAKRLFAMSGDKHNATAIDAANSKVVGTVDLGGGPEFAVADGRGMIYVNLEDKNEVVGIDTNTLKIKSRWPLAPAGTPTAIAMDIDHHRIFSAGRGPQMFVVLDGDSGKVIQSFPISSGADACVYEADSGYIFVSTRDGMVHIFHEDSPDKFTVVQTLQTEFGAKTMALDPKTHNLFLDTADFGPPSAPTAERPDGQRSAIPGTFRVLVYGR